VKKETAPAAVRTPEFGRYRAANIAIVKDLLKERATKHGKPDVYRPAKKLFLMKLSPNFYVFTYEARAKIHVAEEHHEQNQLHKTAASSRRPPESYTGAARRTANASFVRRDVAAGSSATGLF
jgi:hypothetical protein